MRRHRGLLTWALVATAAALALVFGTRAVLDVMRERRQQEVATLERERELLRARLAVLVAKDKRLEGMPTSPLRFGVPTSLARTVIQRVIASFVDQVTLVLANVHADAHGKVKKVVTLGEFRLHLVIATLSGQLQTARPEVAFGGNGVTLALPVTVTRGTGRATLDFSWNGKNVADVVCGDIEISGLAIDGSIEPDEYMIRGTFALASSAHGLSLIPRVPTTKIKLRIAPSPESWARVEAILNERRGVCGWVLDRINVPDILHDLLEQGVSVRLPTEKLKPIALPSGIEEAMTIQGRRLSFAARLGKVAITKRMVWAGAQVSIARAPQERDDSAP